MSHTHSPEIAAYSAATIAVFHDRFEHLEECRIGYLLTDEEIKMQGKVKAGFVTMPTAQGQNRKLYEWSLTQAFDFVDPNYDEPVAPDAIMVIAAEAWEEYSPEQRTMLVFHELEHIAHATTREGEERYSEEDGRPVYSIVGHDVEEFVSVAETFGTLDGNRAFAKLLTSGQTDPRVAEIVAMVEAQTFPALPKRSPVPKFRCPKCKCEPSGEIVQGWLVMAPDCPRCGAKVKPVKRGES